VQEAASADWYYLIETVIPAGIAVTQISEWFDARYPRHGIPASRAGMTIQLC